MSTAGETASEPAVRCVLLMKLLGGGYYEAGVECCDTANRCWAGPASSCCPAGGRESNSSSSLDCSARVLS